MSSLGIAASVLACSFLIASCGTTSDSTKAVEYFDEQTGATVSVVDTPLVFAYSRPELAANLRDYISLVAVAVNRSGTVQYWLVAYFWSTVDRRDDGTPALQPSSLVVAADDRRINLPLTTTSAHEAGFDQQVHAPSGFKGVPSVFRTDLHTLGFIAASRTLTVRLGVDDSAPQYEIWEDARPQLSNFVRSLGGSP